MKKFIVLLLAALLIAGLCISCKQDPEPDKLKGTWKFVNGPETTIMEIDGFGNFKMTYKVKSYDDQVMEGTYKLDNDYFTAHYTIKQPFYPEADPMFVYVHEIDESHAHLALIPWDTSYAYDESDPGFYDGPFVVSNEWKTFTMDGTTYSISDGKINFTIVEEYMDGTTLLSKDTRIGSATIVETGEVYSHPTMKFYDDTYSEYSLKSSYILSASGDKVTIYDRGEAMTFDKQ